MSSLDSLPALLLCGGKGQRMGSATDQVPKPMLTIGGRPLLWHVMQIVASSGGHDFVVAVGHLGHVIKDFFLRFDAYGADFCVRLADGSLRWRSESPESEWQVTCVDTGEQAGTGSRLRDAAQLAPGFPILVAYGDVLANLDIAALVRFHRRHGRLATVTAVRPPSTYGVLSITADQRVDRFDEKLPTSRDWVSAGFFVLERTAIERYIPDDREVMFEQGPIQRLVADDQLMAFQHEGYWQPVDTPQDLSTVRRLWDADEAPWKTWKP